MNNSTEEFNQAYLDESLGPGMITNAVVVMILITVFVGLRYWARWLTNMPFVFEDILFPLSWLATNILCVVAIYMALHAGGGRHQAWVELNHPYMMIRHYKIIKIDQLTQPAAVAFPKVCVVLMYLRVFTNKWERLAAKVTIGIILGAWISYTVAACFQCTPFAFNWDTTIPGGRCFDSILFARSSSVPNIFTDLIILFLPCRTVATLKISPIRKAGLMLIFLTGSIGIVASIIRTIVFQQAIFLVDVTFNIVPVINWSIIEPGLYLMAACALSFKPLLRLFVRFLHLHNLLSTSKATLSQGYTLRDQGDVGTYTDHKSAQMETLKLSQEMRFAADRPKSSRSYAQ